MPAESSRVLVDLAQRAGRQLAQHAAELPAPASPRVLGVGVGVFLLGFFLIVCVVVSLLGARTTKPGAVYAASALAYAVLAAVLLGSPKGYPPPPSPIGYDATAVPLAVTAVLVSLAAVAGVGGVVALHARAPVYARPLSHHADVLRTQ